MKAGIALTALMLAGCATAPKPLVITRTLYGRQTIPPSLLACMAAPPVPQPTSQAEVARYIVALWEAGQDCRVKLAGVRALVAAP